MLATLEIIFYGLNEGIGDGILGASDMGGSMFVHTFGAYFGLAASYFICHKEAYEHEKGKNNKNGSSYNSNLIAMIGTIYLWMFWPSFNGALAEGKA